MAENEFITGMWLTWGEGERNIHWDQECPINEVDLMTARWHLPWDLT